MPGTKEAGYMPPVAGGFKCENCIHLTPQGCNEDEVIEDLGANKDGKADVNPQGCCNFFNPKRTRGIGKHFAERQDDKLL
jgi:hypothetical protein